MSYDPYLKPDIIAIVRFYKTDEGGRKGPTAPPPFWFRCPLEFKNEYFDCQPDFREIGQVYPGDTVKVSILFLCPELIVDRLKAGDKFRLWEMGFIAEGEIVEVFYLNHKQR